MASSDGVVIRHATEEGVFAPNCLPQARDSTVKDGTTANHQPDFVDVLTILELIRELADYEHELSAVQATPELLSQTIAFANQSTSPTRPARCLLLITPQQAVAGLALYFYNYSTWRAAPGIYLEDLFIRPAERRKGYAGMLLAELAKEVVEMKGGRLEWSVLKWNEPSIKFYEGEGIGAKMMSEWVGMRVDGEALVKLAGRARLNNTLNKNA
jgi:GNAT superfamily N-acetyltransferase